MCKMATATPFASRVHFAAGKYVQSDVCLAQDVCSQVLFESGFIVIAGVCPAAGV